MQHACTKKGVQVRSNQVILVLNVGQDVNGSGKHVNGTKNKVFGFFNQAFPVFKSQQLYISKKKKHWVKVSFRFLSLCGKESCSAPSFDLSHFDWAVKRFEPTMAPDFVLNNRKSLESRLQIQQKGNTVICVNIEVSIYYTWSHKHRRVSVFHALTCKAPFLRP